MLPWWVSSCEIDDHTVFLDIKQNRYAAMRSDVGSALLAGDYSEVPRNILAHVTALGWQREEVDGNGLGHSHVEKPTIELSSVSRSAHATKRLMASALICIIITRYRLRTWTFERLLRGVSAANARASDAHQSASIEEIAHAADMVERIALGSKACLLKSLALQRLLCRHGHTAALVIGVRLNPFGAHCWLQQNDVVLNDTIERVGMFTIIRATK